MIKSDTVGPQCQKCGGRGIAAIICEGCDYPEYDCICQKEDDEE